MVEAKFAITMIITALAAGPTLAQDPYTKPDDSWISINGTVAAPTSNSFMLDYGDGVVTVEMDDWDAWGDAYGLLDGDKVSVYGKIDDDLFEMTTIEASSVYAQDLNTYFYASAADEEDAAFWSVSNPLVMSQTTIRGIVTEVDQSSQQFTVDTGVQQLTIDTELLTYNPLDDIGYQQVDVDDRVSVSGMIDREFFEKQVLDAQVVITLEDDDRNS